MKCPRCQHDTPPHARFCSQCAAPLPGACPDCGTSLPAGARFCPGCAHPVDAVAPPLHFASPKSYTPRHLAEKILTSRSTLEGERKQVTVLFVDVSGFTTLSERLDPEDVHRLMTRAFELMLDQVHRYEGTVNQFLGDGIMALFGAPIAHEDHAQRAAHAALGIRTALERYHDELRQREGPTFQARQGLNSGLVVVGSIGSDLRMDYTAVGDTTNVAARLQQAAEPGRIVASDSTHRLIEGYFHVRPLGAHALKGRAEPVRTWEIIGARRVRTRIEVEAERGLTPFVGRERELRLLAECFEGAKRGHGRIVFIVGEPGIGKSRLLHEYRRRMGEEATWLEGLCVSFGRSIAFHPLIDMLKRIVRIDEADTERTIVQKIERGVVRLGEDLRPIVPYLRHLLSVDPGDPAVLALEPQRLRGEIFDALRRLLLRAAEVRPQVVVHEDVHWMDKATEDALLFMADSVPRHPILYVLTYRPGYTHPFGERTYHTRIALDSLSPEDSADMAEAMLATEGLPDALQALIVRKAEGNPFFIEEVLKSLLEERAIRRDGDRFTLTKPLDEIVIPDRVQDVLMARIDRLAEAPKKTLQVASVIGRDFTRRLLDRVADLHGQTDELLRELEAVELIYEKQLFPELAYVFKHALTHEVAYTSLLVQRRKELHRVIALAIEELYADRPAEHDGVLAYHFSRADEWAKALHYLLEAAARAAQAYANGDALALYGQALDAVQHLGDAVDIATRMRIHRARAELHFSLSDFPASRREAERLLELARRAGDRVVEAGALAAMAQAALRAHDFERALADSRRTIALAEAIGAGSPEATARLTIGLAFAVTNHPREAEEATSRALALSRSTGNVVTECMALAGLGLFKNWTGAWEDSLRISGESWEIARARGLLLPVKYMAWTRSMPLIAVGAYDDALAMLEDNLTLCEKTGDEILLQRSLNTLGWLWAEVGDLDRAVEWNRRCLDGARHRNDAETVANAELNLGDAALLKGDVSLAHEYFEDVRRLVQDPATSEWMRWRYSIHLFASLGELALARGDLGRAREAADECLERAGGTGSRKYLARGWRLRGELALARRDRDDAEPALRQALGIAQTIGNPTQLWTTHLALGRLLDETGRPERARAEYRAAREVIERVRGRLRHPELRAALGRAPMIQRVYDLAPRDGGAGV
jgi:class 3 adenylate cyclase/tetratricopeptide (TPR) repeat protein